MSWLFNRDTQSFVDWVTESSPNVHRLLITHTDLDGYGCEVMTMGAVKGNNPNSPSPLKIYHVNPGKDGEAVSMYVNNSNMNYQKGIDKLFILITDLGSISLGFYSNMLKNGHQIRLIVVDHHKVTFKDMMNVYGGWLDRDDIEPACELSFFHDETNSATYQLSDLWASSGSVLNGYFGNIHIYGTLVSRYDTGKWSNMWDSENPQSVSHYAPEVIEQLRFIAYRKKNLLDQYADDMIAALNDINKMYTVVTEDDIENERQCLLREYYRFIRSYIILSSDFMTVPLFKCYLGDNQPFLAVHPNYSVHGIVVKDETENYDYFSMISRKVLEENDDIDILVLVNCVRSKVELRAAKNSIDLSKIAKANGGGGHPKAAGFPLPQAFSAK